MIPVPYVNQVNGAPRKNECGLACVLMLSRWLGKGMTNTVTEMSKRYDAPDDGTTPGNLAQALTDLGLTPVRGGAQYPYIELVYYAKLPFKLDPNGNFLHWIVRLSDTEYHDPYWRGSDGANLKTSKAALDAAEAVLMPIIPGSRVGIKERPTEPTMTKATVKTEVRVRIGPEVNDATWTPLALKEGQQLDGLVQGDFLKYADPRFVVYNKAGQRIDALYSAIKYNGTQFLTLASDPPKPPIPTPSGFKLGISVLNAHHLLEPAYAAGVRSFLIMDGAVAAVNFKRAHPDAIVMYRRYIGSRGIPDPNAFAAEAALGNGIVFVTPLNECDAWCYGTPAEIEARGNFDAALARMCQQHGTIYAAGGFSMGTPDFTKADICEAMRRTYAPGYNAGLYAMNWHTYSPTMGWIYGKQNARMTLMAARNQRDDGVIEMPVGRNGHIATYRINEGKRGVVADLIGQRIWFERRWEWLFDACGFDPSPTLKGIYSDETGVDEGGVGGFPAHGAGCAEIEQWGREFKALSLLPLNSVSSVMRAATIFQAGDPNRWAGYNVQGCFEAIARANQ